MDNSPSYYTSCPILMQVFFIFPQERYDENNKDVIDIPLFDIVSIIW